MQATPLLLGTLVACSSCVVPGTLAFAPPCYRLSQKNNVPKLRQVHICGQLRSVPSQSQQDSVPIRRGVSKLELEEELNASSLDLPPKNVDDTPQAPTSGIASLVGIVDDQRLVFPELSTGEVPRLFSSLEYSKSDDGRTVATHASGSTLGAAALVAGTMIGAGVLALPTATVAAGFLPSSVGMTIAWAFMTMSGLLIAELSLNRFGETGRPGLGLLDLYESLLGKEWGVVSSVAYFFLHYAVMCAYFAQGGSNMNSFLSSFVDMDSITSQIPGIGQLIFVGSGGVAVYVARQSVVEQVNNVLVLGVFASFLGILTLGAGSADFDALTSAANQHPEAVISAFPILFLSVVFHNIVPTVVAQLEGDRTKITRAITMGTTLPFLMLLAWNAVILGNVLGMVGGSGAGLAAATSSTDPISILQSGTNNAGTEELLSSLVGGFSELALITSIIGFVYGLLDALTDVTGIPSEGPDFEKWRPALYAGVFLPPLALSMSDPEIFYKALDYGGAFGVSTLFLLLPPIMVWKSRYGAAQSPLSTKPMVPLGKIPLVAMLGAAGALISQQAFEKFGVSSMVMLQDQLVL